MLHCVETLLYCIVRSMSSSAGYGSKGAALSSSVMHGNLGAMLNYICWLLRIERKAVKRIEQKAWGRVCGASLCGFSAL